MNRAQELAASLARVSNDAIARWVAPDATGMAIVADKISQRSAAVASRRQPEAFDKRLIAAIGRFRENADPELDFRTLRLVCHGCCHEISQDGYTLLADPRALEPLLGSVAGYAHEPRRFRRLYHGLLQAYLMVDRQAAWFGTQAARLGNDLLRQFLYGTFDNIRSLEPSLTWTRALADHRDILSERPTERFVRDWHAGNQADFLDAIDRLGLAGSSWLVAATLNDVIATAANQDDAAFVAQVPAFLDMACEQRFQSLRDSIFVALVTRYSGLAKPVVHPALRDALIDAWKNPWLERNQSAWGRVPDAARKMVSGWLKLDLIHQFFEVLSEDGGQDKSRFEFWRDYHHQIDDVHFALGSHAYNSRDSDTVKLRKSLDGRLLRLSGSDSANNAFIMLIGENVFIEFSKKGNAAYRYHWRDFEIPEFVEPIKVSELKRNPPGVRMIHDSKRGLSWQEWFAEVIAKPTLHTPTQPAARNKPHPESAPSPVHAQTVAAYARERSIKVDDKRPLGGSLWMRIDNADPDISKTLRAWGFKYAPGKGWWRTGP